MSDPSTQPPYTMAINNYSHFTANTTTLSGRFYSFSFFVFFFFTNKYCYNSMYMQQQLWWLNHQHKPPYTATINDDGHVTANTTTLYMRRHRWRLFQQHNHLTPRPSTTTAMSQPTQPPWSVGFFFFFLLYYFTNKYCYSSMYMQRWRLTHRLNHLTQ